MTSQLAGRLRKYTPLIPDADYTEIVISSKDGDQMYYFDAVGRHQRTTHSKTGSTLYTFGYNNHGHLTQVGDGDGNITRIQRNASGKPTAIVSPDGVTTALALDANGMLASISDPIGGAHRMKYLPNGLLTEFKDPNGNESTASYDARGFLTMERDAAGGSIALERTRGAASYQVKLTSAMGRVTLDNVQLRTDGSEQLTDTFPDGTSTTVVTGTSGTQSSTQADGTTVTVSNVADPRFGMQMPYPMKTVVRLPSGLISTTEVVRTIDVSSADPVPVLVRERETRTVNGRDYASEYEAQSKRWIFTSPEGRNWTIDLDSRGRTMRININGFVATEFTRDGRGRLITLSQGAGLERRRTEFSCSVNGEIASRTDSLGRVTTYVRDQAGRLSQLTLPTNRTTVFDYDPNGNTTSVTPPGRAEHQFTYTPVNLEVIYQTPAFLPPHPIPGSNITWIKT